MTASTPMAKTKKPPEDKAPVFPATPAYKQWVWKEIRRRGWKLQGLVDAMKRADRSISGGALTRKISTSTLVDLLGGEDAERRYLSNSSLIPCVNKALDLAPPSVTDPESPLGQLKDRIDALWRIMDAYQRERFLRAMEDVLGLADPNGHVVPRHSGSH